MLNFNQLNTFYLVAQNQFLRIIVYISKIFYRNNLYAILLGLPGLALSIERIIRYFNQENSSINKSLYFDWAKNYAFPEQRYQIIGYIIASVVGYLIFLVSLFGVKKETENKILLLISICVSLILDIAPKFNSIHFILFVVVAWTCLAVINIENKLFNSKVFYSTFKRIISGKAFYIALTCIVFGSFVYINSSFLQKQFVLYNDNADLIPYGDIKKSLGTTDNSTNNLFMGMQCDQAHNLGKINPYKGLKSRLQGTMYYLIDDTSELCFYGLLGEGDFKHIQGFLPNFPKEKFQEVLDLNEEYAEKIDKEYEEKINKKLNQTFEINKTYEQFENIFHHHFQFLGPLNKFQILKDSQKVDSLYGLAYLPVSFVLNNFLNYTYENFIALFFTINIVYLLAFIFLISRIFKSIKYIAIIALVMTGSIYSLGYVTYFTGLGYGAFRHFFDVFVLYSIYQYLKKGQDFYLILTFILSFLALFLNLEFGLAILLALDGMLLLKIISKDSNFKEKIVLFIGNTLCLICIYFFNYFSGKNIYTGNFLSGMWGFPIEGWRIYMCVAIFIMLFAYSLRKSSADRSNLSIFFPLYLLFYSTLITTYWMLIPNYGHFYSILPFFIITLLAYLYFDCQSKYFYRINFWVVNIALIFSLIFFIQSLQSFLISKQEVDASSKIVKIYKWNFERAKLKSTINPVYFEGAINLINKYSKPGEGIYIISPFDNILYWLSNTYSKMPSSDMLANLSMPRDLELTNNFLNSNLPEFIFVGSCVDCLNTFSSINFQKYGVSTARVKERMERLNNLESVFNGVIDHYRLIEAGELISVYQKKN